MGVYRRDKKCTIMRACCCFGQAGNGYLKQGANIKMHISLNHWNFARLLGISFLNTSTCRATILSFRSSTPLLSNPRIPFPYITVKSGRTSPSATSHSGPILQCYNRQRNTLHRGISYHTLPNMARFPIFALTSIMLPSPTMLASTIAPTSMMTPFSITTPCNWSSAGSLCNPI